ncbi:DUF5693 family protein [Cytobacillus firmus]|uniref:DUF5693 family protein n=1 Tax=Cytobacillus firmus TaxID=1399 RepID=UPI0020412A8B|nr:DUF5693 family protein [Cytobacillus firmus]MCM3704264.1 DUF5693 family protein [Cytobacillus firmus]
MKKAVLSLLILSLLLTLPGLMKRHQAEWNNRNYETVIPFQDIQTLVAKDPSLKLEDVLQDLKDAGLHAVSVQPETLNSLEDIGDINVLTGGRIQEMSILNSELDDAADRVSNEGAYIQIQNENKLTGRLTDVFQAKETVRIADKEFIHFPSLNSAQFNETPIGYTEEMITEIKKADLSVVFRMPNSLDEKNSYVFNQLLDLSDEKSNRLLISGNEVIGYPDIEKIKRYAQKLKEENIAVYAIEFSDQVGIGTMARALDYNIIRLHSIDLNKVPSMEEGVDRAVRAVKERNIRSLFIRVEKGSDSKEALLNTEEFIQAINNQLPVHYKAGKAQVFDPISVPYWSQLAALVAAVLFISIAVQVIFSRRALFYASLAGLFLIAAAAFLLKTQILLQGLALLVAIITPIFAVIPIKNRKGIFLTYGRAALISFAGIIIITSLLNGNEYLIKIEAFRGVKLTYIVPILFVMIYALLRDFKSILNMKVQYWHLAVIGLIGFIGLYYISRTGNAGSVSSIELAFRQWLEEVLYVRPRTKEFLIGFPFFVFALYIYPLHQKISLYLLIPGVIGYLSIVNTFTHLHIPLYISLLRTFYSLVLGLVIGLLFIFLYKQGRSIYEKKWKLRC